MWINNKKCGIPNMKELILNPVVSVSTLEQTTVYIDMTSKKNTVENILIHYSGKNRKQSVIN